MLLYQLLHIYAEDEAGSEFNGERFASKALARVYVSLCI